MRLCISFRASLGPAVVLAAAMACCPAFAIPGQDAVNTIARNAIAAEQASLKQDWPAVKALLEPIVSTETLDGRLWHLLGRAYFNTGDFTRALPTYERVFELRQGVPSSAAYTIAVCHARLGHDELALEWLERAVALGYRYMNDPRAEEAFAGLRSNPRFVRLFWTRDKSALSREEGWRLDLDVLAAEVKRKAVHPFLTRSRDRLDWGAKLTEAEFDVAVAGLKARIDGLSDMQLGIEIQRLLRKVGDGHTGAYPSEGRAALPMNLPILTFEFVEGMYIIAAAEPYADLLGSRITAIDGRSLREIAADLGDLISRDNERWVSQVLPYRLRNTSLLHALRLIRSPDEATLSLVDERGQTSQQVVRASAQDGNIWNTLPAPKSWASWPKRLGAKAPLYLRQMDDYYWFEFLESRRTVYFQYNKVLNKEGSESLDAFAGRLSDFILGHDVEKLVVDLRWNNGGDTFLNEALLQRLVRNPKLNAPGRLVVIIGRRTFSAAMNAAVSFERHMQPIFVGEPTGGKPNSPGDETWQTLPYSNIGYNVSDMFWQAGWPYDFRPWIAPRIPVPPRFVDFKEGRDAALEAALMIEAGSSSAMR